MYRNVYRLFIFVLVFSPLAFGTVEAWSLAVMQCLASVAALFFFLKNVNNDESPLYEVPGIVPLLFLLAFMALQAVPFPASLVKFISPGTYDVYDGTTGIVEPSRWLPLSVGRKGTMLEVMRFSSYVLFYILTVQLLSGRKPLKKTVAVVVFFASALSFVSILQHFLAPERALWVRELTKGGSPFGPYVNRNHYAGFMAMVMPVAVGLLLAYKPHVAYASIREKLMEIFSQNRTNIHVLLIFSSVLIGASIFVSLSRSGIISVCFSMLVLGLLILRTNWKRGMFIIVVFMLLFLSVGWFGWEPVFERFERIRTESGDIADLRMVIWKDGLDIIGRFPLFGAGFGSFVDIYRKFGSVAGGRIVDHAHNDYLEFLAEGGAIAFALAGWFVAAVLFRAAKLLSVRVERYSIYLTMGTIAGIASLFVHSVTDFNLHIGANGLYFFFLMGLAVSASGTRLRSGLNRTYLREVNRKWGKKMLALTALLTLFVIAGNAGVLLGKFYFSSVDKTNIDGNTPEQDLLEVKELSLRASLFDPLEAKYRYAAANAGLLLEEDDLAIKHYADAISLAPLKGEYLQRLGMVFSLREGHETANALLRSGTQQEPLNPERHRRYAVWLLSQGDRSRGLKHLRDGISLEPEKTRNYITYMLLFGIRTDEIDEALPEAAGPYLSFGDFLFETGRAEAGEAAYLRALEFVENDEIIRPSYFYKVYSYYFEGGRYEDALMVMRRAAELLPDNPGIRLTMARLYERLGIIYRAKEEYEKALIIDPGNRGARRGLDGLISR